MPLYDVEIPINPKTVIFLREIEAEDEAAARQFAAKLLFDAVIRVAKVEPYVFQGTVMESVRQARGLKSISYSR